MADNIKTARESIQRAIKLVDDELHGKSDPLLSFISRETFITYREYLGQMYEVLEKGRLPQMLPEEWNFADNIIMNWPFTFVGQGIVEAQQAFEKLLKGE